MQTRRALLLAASLGLVVSCDTADMSDPSGEEQEGTGVKAPSGSDSSEGDSDSADSKIHVSDGVKAALSRGEAQDLIVTLNSSAVRGQKSKVSTFAGLRSAVMKDLAGIRANLTREYSHLPYMVIRAKDASVLEALEATENVKGVFDNEVFKPASSQVLSAINWTPVAGTAAGSGDGITVAVLDTNVTFAFAAPFNETKSIAGDTDTGETTTTHGDAMVAAIRAVAPGVGIRSYDIYDDNVTSAANVLEGLNDVIADAATISAVNLSFEGTLSSGNANCDTNSLHEAIADLVDAGVAVVAAAGNSGSNTQLAQPACDSLVISVGATFDTALAAPVTYDKTTGTCAHTVADSTQDNIACFSNYSSKLTLLAPGATIDLDWDSGSAGADNTLKYGTSYSAAFVTGAIAALHDTYAATQDMSWMRERLLMSSNAMGLRTGVTIAKDVLDVGASNADKCLSHIDDVLVDIPAAGTLSTPIPVELEFNKTTGCTATATSGVPSTPTAWLTVAAPAASGGEQEVTFAAPVTDVTTTRTGTATCPNTDAYGADKNLAKCVLLSAGTGETFADQYVRVAQAGDAAKPSDVNASVEIVDGSDDIFTTADDVELNTPGMQATVNVTVTSVTDLAATAGFTYCITTSSTATGCVYQALPALPVTLPGVTVTLSSTDGLKTAYLFVRDPAGNRADAETGTTILDTQVPGSGTLSVTNQLNQVALSFVLPTKVGSPFASGSLRRNVATLPTTAAPTCAAGDAGTEIKAWVAADLDTETTVTYADPFPAATGLITYNYTACVTDGAAQTSPGSSTTGRPRGDVDAPVLGGVSVTSVTGTTGTFAQLVTAGKCLDNAAPAADRCFTNAGAVVEFQGLTGTPAAYCFTTVQNGGCTDSAGDWNTLSGTPGTCAAGVTGITPADSCLSAALDSTKLLDGARTYFWYVRDADKNVSVLDPAGKTTFSLYRDVQAPPGGSLTITPKLLSNEIRWAGALDTGSKNLSYKVQAKIGAEPLANCVGAGDETTVSTDVTPASFPIIHTGLTASDTWFYRVCLTDRAGNTSAGTTGSVKVRGDLTGPTPLAADGAHTKVAACAAIGTDEAACENADCHWNGAACVANLVRFGDSKWTKKGRPRAWVEAVDNETPASGLEVCLSANSLLVKNCSNWVKYEDQLVTTNMEIGLVSISGDGEKYVSAWVRDSWGNHSDSNAADGSQAYRDKIGVDRTAPVVGTAEVALSGTTATITLSGVAEPAKGYARGLDLAANNKTVEVYFAKSASPPGASACTTHPAASQVCKTDMLTGGAASCTHTGLTPGKYAYRVCAADANDNWNVGATTGSITIPTP